MENERGFTIKDLLIRLVLIVVFIFLLIWLFPMPDLKPLNNQIFADNIDRMKNVAKTYYTIERLPENINDYKKMTLKEMIENKLILPLMDSNGNYCSEKDSYIQITKLENEYIIKVYLSCSDKQDYIIEHFGCYDICSEKCKPSTVTTTTTKGNVTTTLVKKPTITTTRNYGKIYEYQFVKNVCNEKFDKYVCPSGYYLIGNKCIKNGSSVDTKPADKEIVKVSVADSKDAEVVYKNTENKTAAVCKESTVNSTINATPSTTTTDKVVVKVQKVTADKKYTYDIKGAVGTKKTTTASYNIVQNYDVITATKTATYAWKYVSTLTTDKSNLAFENENEKLILVDSWLEDTCVGCATKVTVYKYWRYKKQVTGYSYSCSNFPGYSLYDTNKCRKATTQTKECPKGYNPAGSVCEKVDITYSCSSYGSGYVLDNAKKTCTKLVKTTYSCPSGTNPTSDEKYCSKNVYGCPNGTNETSNGKCSKTTYSCPKNTSTKTYTLNGTKCNVTTKQTTCSCPNGGTLTSDKKYCVTTSSVPTYSCDKYPGYLKVGNKCVGTVTQNKEIYTCKNYKGYILSGTNCVKPIITTDSKDATPTYKTECNNEYMWSTKTSVDGWTYTGNKREVK